MSQKKQKNRFITVGLKKGGLNCIADIVVDGRAVVTFWGPLEDTSASLYHKNVETSYDHGPWFLFAPKSQKYKKKGKEVIDIPISKGILLLQKQEEINSLTKTLGEAVKDGLLTKERYNDALKRIITYKDFHEKYILESKEQSKLSH